MQVYDAVGVGLLLGYGYGLKAPAAATTTTIVTATATAPGAIGAGAETRGGAVIVIPRASPGPAPPALGSAPHTLMAGQCLSIIQACVQVG